MFEFIPAGDKDVYKRTAFWTIEYTYGLTEESTRLPVARRVSTLASGANNILAAWFTVPDTPPFSHLDIFIYQQDWQSLDRASAVASAVVRDMLESVDAEESLLWSARAVEHTDTIGFNDQVHTYEITDVALKYEALYREASRLTVEQIIGE